MACGKKIRSDLHSNYEMGDVLRDSTASYDLVRKVERGECLDDRELREAENALYDYGGMCRDVDYRESDCW